jgi:hypothetical protein
MCFASLLGGARAQHEELLDSVRDLLRGGRKGWNREVTERVGLPLLEGITAYFDGDYRGAVAVLAPAMPELQAKLQGSRAQKDVFRQILLSAAVHSGSKADLALAQQVAIGCIEPGLLLCGRFWPRSWRIWAWRGTGL